MSKRSAQLLLADIVSAINKIEHYTSGFTREQFLEDERTSDAVVRNLEIIGEATRQLPDEYKQQHSSIPWTQMAGLRNRIVHAYFGIDLDIIWSIIQDDLIRLREQAQTLLDEMNQIG
jgi:uncharacterized protein with HEPN domain